MKLIHAVFALAAMLFAAAAPVQAATVRAYVNLERIPDPTGIHNPQCIPQVSAKTWGDRLKDEAINAVGRLSALSRARAMILLTQNGLINRHARTCVSLFLPELTSKHKAELQELTAAAMRHLTCRMA